VKLTVSWRVNSGRLAAWLDAHAGCPHCGCSTDRLVRHVITASHTQVWISCLKCSAKLGGGPQPHVPDHPRVGAYPVWREDMGSHLQPEELEEIENARPRPLTFGELSRVIYGSARLMTEIRACGHIGIALGCACAPADILALGRLFTPGDIVAAFDEDRASAWLMKVEADRLQASPPIRMNGRTNWSAPIIVPHTPETPEP
jgi:hypothetical protein